MQSDGSGFASPPLSPSRPLSYQRPKQHQPRQSVVSNATHRVKPSLSRFNDAVTSRSSDDDAGRTAVKVAVRVRPALRPTDPGFDLIPQRFRQSTCEVPTPTSLSIQSPQGKKLFVFDRVFSEDTSQDGIWDYLSDSVGSFIKGYNVSILAYGQSGSGKSYTMGTSGPEDQDDPRIMGIIPRAAHTLFERLHGVPKRQSGLPTPKNYSSPSLSAMNGFSKGAGVEQNWTLKATYVEIYQEQLRDLLVSDSIPPHERPQVAIREDTKGRILVTGLTQVPITSVDDLLNALSFGSSIRQTDSTNLNARSSRSHAIFSLNLVQKKTEGTATPRTDKRMSVTPDTISGTESVVTVDSKLHFVDLAGSERLKNTGATGDRAKEGISINAGLASLGKVISQLSSKNASAHISYRDSRLTRLLQDSLGGNAITFMVACVTPAVFHLSETLNTVHYAQRARAIQSKPEIQQTHEEGDKQAAIDRLRAEVSFLRDQIRHAEHPENKTENLRGWSSSARGREAELQQEIMDMQENYNALSQRHAKLISDLSQARSGEVDMPTLDTAIGENAMDRIKRSNSFAEAVEQMVLEYEKTIQTLESSLSKTRSSLSNSESTLMEKETRIAYMETIQQQLQARIQKSLDREQSNESYLRDLELRMEGTADGEEKNAHVIGELRNELGRVRENESNAEDYISTLEERLADAEQDQEIMQREIDRLEHVVERQRSIGRLDNLLGELDEIRSHRPAASVIAEEESSAKAVPPKINGVRASYDPFRPNSAAASSQYSTDPIMEDVPEEEELGLPTPVPRPDGTTATEDAIQTSSALAAAHSATQSDFMADKLENLTQELFDLRSEHESVMTDYDKLQQKYKTALETLANLEYEKDVPASPLSASSRESTSFLADAGMGGEEEAGEREPSSSSRSSLEEPSSPPPANSSLTSLTEKVGLEQSARSTTTPDVTEDELVDPTQVSLPEEPQEDPQLEALKRLHAEKEMAMTELESNYNNLLAKHESSLAQIEDLKRDAHRASTFRPVSQGFNKSMFRRKSEDLLGNQDAKASRSLASLKNMAQDNFDDDPDLRAAFDLNVNTIMNELQTRAERLFALEGEMSTIKKELDAKQTIIMGLTRERSSLKASSTVDFSIVGQMQEQLRESERQIRSLQTQHDAREKKLQGQIETLKASLADHANQLPTPVDDADVPMPGDFPVTPADEINREVVSEDDTTKVSDHADNVARLQSELAAWESKHENAMESMKKTETELLQTIAGLEKSLSEVESRKAAPVSDVSTVVQTPEAAAALASIEEERTKHREIVDALQNEVHDYKSTAQAHLQKLEQLEQSYEDVVHQLEENAMSRDLSSKELRMHQELVANLEDQVQAHKSAIMSHQQSLETLQATHSREIEDLQVSMAAAEKTSQERYMELEERHATHSRELQDQLVESKVQNSNLLRRVSLALGYDADADVLHTHIQDLVDEGKELHSRHMKSTSELKTVQENLSNALSSNAELESKVGELKSINDEVMQKLNKATEREKKSSRLVDELEEQLNSNFDSHKAATNRLSLMQGEVVQQRIELERELEDQKMRNSVLEQQVAIFQRQSVTSNHSFNRESLSPDVAAIALARSGSSSSQPSAPLPPAPTSGPSRKSSVANALPTPPPSIPLPPLPSSPTTAGPVMNGLDAWANSTSHTSPIQPQNGGSPPSSRHVSKDGGAVPTSPQQLEEQEARIRTIEKHLFAEKQLTATLEEALVDLETSANRTKSEMETWRKKCSALEDELVGLRKEKTSSRASLQAVEEEREMRVRAERARQALEQRMVELNAGKKKKKNALNCF